MENDLKNKPGFSSPPCFAHELTLDENGYMAIDAQTALDVARFRKAKREELIAARLKFSVRDRRENSMTIARSLDRIVAPVSGKILSLYWPMKGEPNLRDWMKRIIGEGGRIALPVVKEKAQPMIFREWTPDCKMEPGIWQIPVPVHTEEIIPDIVIAPLVGFDAACYRLGYGGGYFDRTLTRFDPRPKIIGIGYADSRLSTIFPQPYDIPMDLIVTGDGEVITRES